MSALNQTEQSIEIIIVNDGSSDKTAEIAERLAQTSPKIKTYTLEKNQGRSAALNFGVLQATGTWVAVLDADDWYAPERLTVLLDKADAEDVQMVADNQFILGKNDSITSAFREENADHFLKLDTYLSKSNALSRFDYGMLKPIIKLSFFKESGLEYYLPARNGQDFYFLLSFFTLGGRGLIVGKPYYYYVSPMGALNNPNESSKKSYNFQLMRQVNRHFMDKYANTYSAKNMKHLLKRDRDFTFLITYHEIKGCFFNRDYKQALCKLYNAPITFLPLVFLRIYKKIFKAMRLQTER